MFIRWNMPHFKDEIAMPFENLGGSQSKSLQMNLAHLNSFGFMPLASNLGA